MITNLLHEYRRRKYGLPRHIRRLWLAGDYWKRNIEDEGEPKTDLDYEGETYTTGEKVEVFDEEDYTAIYEITKIRGNSMADTLPWDDNKKYDFKFHKVTSK